MAFDAKTQRLISLKKLSGKAHTSNDKGLANEGLPSGITMSKSTIFSSDVPVSPSAASLYTITSNSVEFLRLSASFIAGTDTIRGRHGFELKLPDDYEAQSSNPRAGTYPYLNGQSIQVTSGSLQLVPPSFATSYEAKVYHTGSGETRIFLLDSRDWNLDYFNGVFFQQDPPGTGDDTSNPRYVDAYLYIGDYLTGTIGSGGAGGGGSVAAGVGISGTVAGDTTTLDLDIIGLTSDPNAGSLFDSIAISDASDSDTPKRITLTQLQSLFSTENVLDMKRVRENYVLSADYSAGDTVHVTSTNFTPGKFSPNTTDVLVNGQLLFSGTAGQVTAGSADYTLTGTGSIQFSFPLTSGDIVTTTVLQSGSTSQSSASDFYLMHSDSSLPNARTLQEGVGIELDSDTAGKLIISSKRQKVSYLLTGSHGFSSPLNLGSGVDFSSGSYKDEHIDIFVNGALMASGTLKDYELAGDQSSVIFTFDLDIGDIVTSIVGA